MKLERLNDLQLEVADVDRSARWYRRMLGLRIVAQGLRLVSGTPLRARQFRLGVHLDDRVAVRRWRAHVDASGGFGNPVTESAGYYGCTVADPDGYLVEFYTEAPEV
ncbi:MAG: VOC family protein [Proteobacteria bacterium]|nr:VOC family protein [Pseudomonadota bacterium]